MAGKDTVCIAIDGSEHSQRAFEWYIEHLHRPGNKVVLAHSVEMPSIPTRDAWDEQMKEGNKKKQDLEEKYKVKLQELSIDGYLVSNYEKPGEMICNTAQSEKCNYIVMGTRGMGKLRRTIVGSVSDYVVHHAHCPILVARN